jgi:hypothetical protein
MDNLEKPTNKGVEDNNNSNEHRVKIKVFKVDNITLKVDTDWLKTTIKVPNISAHNFGGGSGVPLNEIGKQIAKEIFSNLKKALTKQGIEAGKKKIKETIMRKIGNTIGIDNLGEKLDLGNIKNSISNGADSIKSKAKNMVEHQVKDKAKDLLKGLGF